MLKVKKYSRSGLLQLLKCILVLWFLINSPLSFSKNHPIELCSEVFQYRGEAYFCGKHHEYGRELFRSNGSISGTYIVKDIDKGLGGSGPRNFFVFKDKLYFFAETAHTGFELYVTQGSSATTKLIKDTTPGPKGNFFGAYSPPDIYVSRDYVFYVNDDQLWRTNGTYSGTFLIADGVGRILVENEGWLYFEKGSNKLFKANGNADSVSLVKDFGDSCRFISRVRESYHQGRNIFANSLIPLQLNCDSEWATWVTDGTPSGTKLLGSFDGLSEFLGEINGEWIMYGYRAEQVFKSDGESVVTLARDQTCCSGIGLGAGGRAINVTIGNKLIFSYGDRTSRRLWVTDGSVQGTVPIEAQGPRGQQTVGSLAHAKLGNKMLYAKAETARFDSPSNLWISDATTVRKLVDMGGGRIRFGTAAGNNYLFIVRNSGSNNSFTLWSSDGSVSGTTPLTSFNLGSSNGFSGILRVYVEDQRLYFQDNQSLWHSDGTKPGTFRLAYSDNIADEPIPNLNTPLMLPIYDLILGENKPVAD